MEAFFIYCWWVREWCKKEIPPPLFSRAINPRRRRGGEDKGKRRDPPPSGSFLQSSPNYFASFTQFFLTPPPSSLRRSNKGGIKSQLGSNNQRRKTSFPPCKEVVMTAAAGIFSSPDGRENSPLRRQNPFSPPPLSLSSFERSHVSLLLATKMSIASARCHTHPPTPSRGRRKARV